MQWKFIQKFALVQSDDTSVDLQLEPIKVLSVIGQLPSSLILILNIGWFSEDVLFKTIFFKHFLTFFNFRKKELEKQLTEKLA